MFLKENTHTQSLCGMSTFTQVQYEIENTVFPQKYLFSIRLDI